MVKIKIPWSEAELRELYLEDKKSSREIARFSKCSEHKVNYWLEKHVIPKRSISDAVYAKHNPDGDPFHIRQIKTVDDAKLLGLGLGIYWGEGNKKSKSSVRVGNSDPKLIKNFVRFLISILGVRKSKLKFGLQVFGDMPKGKVLKFWLNELKEFNVKPEQFFKVTITPYRGVGNYGKKSKVGVLTVHFGNIKLKRLLDGMLPM